LKNHQRAGNVGQKEGKKAHLKRMADIKKGKRKRYAGESFTCNIM